jgi:hypothetical protein
VDEKNSFQELIYKNVSSHELKHEKNCLVNLFNRQNFCPNYLAHICMNNASHHLWTIVNNG